MNHASLSTRLLKTNSYPKSCNTIQFNCALIKRINHLRDIIREGGLWSITINNAFCCLCLLIANQHPAGNIYFCLSTCLISFATFLLSIFWTFCHMSIWYLPVCLTISFSSCPLVYHLVTCLSDISLSLRLSPCPLAYFCLSSYFLGITPSSPCLLVHLLISLPFCNYFGDYVWPDVVILVSQSSGTRIAQQLNPVFRLYNQNISPISHPQPPSPGLLPAAPRH